MKKLGIIENKTTEGLLIIESLLKDPRKLVGAIVYDRDFRRLGKIIDVIGRADSPYIVVKPVDKRIAELVEVGTTVYYRIEKKPRRLFKKRKGRSRRGGGRRQRRRR